MGLSIYISLALNVGNYAFENVDRIRIHFGGISSLDFLEDINASQYLKHTINIIKKPKVHIALSYG